MPRKGPELDLQLQVVQLAEILGWEHVAWRPMLTKHGLYKTGGMGTMAKGWPDLTLVRVRDRRLIFAELKGSKRDKLRPEQEHVLGILRSLEVVYGSADNRRRMGEIGLGEQLMPQIEVHVWRPDDWPEIEATLR